MAVSRGLVAGRPIAAVYRVHHSRRCRRLGSTQLGRRRHSSPLPSLRSAPVLARRTVRRLQRRRWRRESCVCGAVSRTGPPHDSLHRGQRFTSLVRRRTTALLQPRTRRHGRARADGARPPPRTAAAGGREREPPERLRPHTRWPTVSLDDAQNGRDADRAAGRPQLVRGAGTACAASAALSRIGECACGRSPATIPACQPINPSRDPALRRVVRGIGRILKSRRVDHVRGNPNGQQRNGPTAGGAARYRILDTKPEQAFDDLVLLASQICETPIALVTLLNYERQWFKSRVGTTLPQTERGVAFCEHTIRHHEVFEVPETRPTTDSANPLVIDDPRCGSTPGPARHAGRARGRRSLRPDRVPRVLARGTRSRSTRSSGKSSRSSSCGRASTSSRGPARARPRRAGGEAARRRASDALDNVRHLTALIPSAPRVEWNIVIPADPAAIRR